MGGVGGGGGGRISSPSGRGTCRGGTGGELHARYPAPCALAFPLHMGRGNGGDVDVRLQGGLLFLLEALKACAVFPLGTVQNDA